MTSSDIRLIITKLKNMNRSIQEKLDESFERRTYFKRRAVEVGEDYEIGYKVTIGELLREQKKLVESDEREIEENKDLIAKLEEELKEVK